MRHQAVSAIALLMLVLVVQCNDSPTIAAVENNNARPYHIAINTSPPSRKRQSDDIFTYDPFTVKYLYGFQQDFTVGDGQTIAIVCAQNADDIYGDLAVFNSQWGLPECTLQNGCLTIVNQTGGSILPQPQLSWAQEIMLDVSWAHAIAPGARKLLVLAASANFIDLMTAVEYAAQRAKYVSMSFGAPEFAGQEYFDKFLTRQGVSFFVSSGDTGATPFYPATSPYVIGVGATKVISSSDSQFVSEIGWSSSGGGCSSYYPSPAGQQTGSVNCRGKRASPDVSMLGDPLSGVYVYSSYNCAGKAFQNCWLRMGGTSLSAPIWAARASATGQVFNVGSLYSGRTSAVIQDITTGASSNGYGVSYAAGTGYDLVTGLGSWSDIVRGGVTTTVAPSTTTSKAPTTTVKPTQNPVSTRNATTSAPGSNISGENNARESSDASLMSCSLLVLFLTICIHCY